jgi:hypothetical protein
MAMIITGIVILMKRRQHKADEVAMTLLAPTIQNVAILERLGGGAFGDVYHGTVDVLTNTMTY